MQYELLCYWLSYFFFFFRLLGFFDLFCFVGFFSPFFEGKGEALKILLDSLRFSSRKKDSKAQSQII